MFLYFVKSYSLDKWMRYKAIIKIYIEKRKQSPKSIKNKLNWGQDRNGWNFG